MVSQSENNKSMETSHVRVLLNNFLVIRNIGSRVKRRDLITVGDAFVT